MRPVLSSLALGCLALCACSPRPQVLPQATAQESASPPQSAEPLERPGLSNLHRVTPTLYRGAQPTEEGFRELAELGVKTVVSLRGFHADDIPHELPLAYERIPFKAWHPEDEDVVRFLQIVSDPARQPVFVHCQWGADRTGMMIAIERIALEGWTKDQALDEMTKGGFGFHEEWQNLIRYVRELDVEKLAREAGIRR
jgi:protein tyrosine/serine phosphatase